MISAPLLLVLVAPAVVSAPQFPCRRPAEEEGEELCRSSDCHPSMTKCRDGVQCQNSNSFCRLARWTPQRTRTFQCSDDSQDSVWACREK